MTPTELKLYSLPGMQKLFRERMGQHKRSDIGYVNGLGMGIMHGNGLMYFENGSSINPDFCADYIRIPLPIDPINPERGLWGMVKNIDLLEKDGFGKHTLMLASGYTFREATPTEALLRAIMHQEGIKEE